MTHSTQIRSRPHILVATVSLIAACLLLTTASGAAANPPMPAVPRTSSGEAREVFTGLIASPLAKPHPVVGADGRRHLVYELQLINSTSAAVTVTKVETVDPATGRVLATLDADAVAALMVPFGAAPGPTLGPGRAGFILMDASLPAATRVPARLAHDFSLTYDPDQGLPTQQRSGLTDVARDRARVIGAPLEGPRWVVVNGCCAGPTSHRLAVTPINGAFYVSERFAIDFAQLTVDKRLVQGDPEQLASYPTYGADVISVARGVVVRTLDGIADNVPVGSLPPFSLETVGGNYVVVDIGGGHFAFYAHLQPGSLRVRVGDRVTQGQVLGLLGNSGNSDFPHLHFHVTDSPSPLTSDGLPYEFTFFDSDGTLANGDEVTAGGVAIFDPALSGPHSHQLPLNLQVINFPTRHDNR
jgi:Peptidase family M23